MRKTIPLGLCLCLWPIEAMAISRYTSTSMSCNEAQAVVAQQGAVILRYHSTRNPNLPLYNRYVASGGYCGLNEYAKWDYVPTADTASCPVRRCAPLEYDENN